MHEYVTAEGVKGCSDAAMLLLLLLLLMTTETHISRRRVVRLLVSLVCTASLGCVRTTTVQSLIES